VKFVADKLEAHCTATNWSAENKKCVMDAPDAVKALEAAKPAADGSAAAGSAAAGSAAPGSAK
jgi:hypothetical protein